MTQRENGTQFNRRTLLAAAAGMVGGVALGPMAARGAPDGIPVDASLPAGRIPVAFVMDNAATMIDFAGPWEVFQDASDGPNQSFHLFTVAATNEELQTTGNIVNGKMSGLRYRPDFTFANAPQPKVLVMGAQSGRGEEKLEWIRKAAANADAVLSVCTGAFLLAATGLLDGLKATTHHDFYDQFASKYPTVTLVRGRRFVDNGKFVTAGGLTSGIDAALHIVERYHGRAATEQVAAYMEHYSEDWKSGSSRSA
jgi:transcriptional regulator GlxA family with amidase domain